MAPPVTPPPISTSLRHALESLGYTVEDDGAGYVLRSPPRKRSPLMEKLMAKHSMNVGDFLDKDALSVLESMMLLDPSELPRAYLMAKSSMSGLRAVLEEGASLETERVGARGLYDLLGLPRGVPVLLLMESAVYYKVLGWRLEHG